MDNTDYQTIFVLISQCKPIAIKGGGCACLMTIKSSYKCTDHYQTVRKHVDRIMLLQYHQQPIGASEHAP